MKRILIVIITLGIILFLAYFGVDNPGAGCNKFFSGSVDIEDYNAIDLDNCGEESRGAEENILQIKTCLQDAMNNCNEKKAFVRIPGVEVHETYILQTTKDCRLKITGGYCSSATRYCTEMPAGFEC
jgi:hypothetical protein